MCDWILLAQYREFQKAPPVKTRTLLSVCDSEITTHIVFSRIWIGQLFITTGCIVLILPNTVLLLYGQVADRGPRQTNGVVLWIRDDTIGNPPQNTRSWTTGTLYLCCVSSDYMEHRVACPVTVWSTVLRVQWLYGAQCYLIDEVM
jgi:hypothetical protein